VGVTPSKARYSLFSQKEVLPLLWNCIENEKTRPISTKAPLLTKPDGTVLAANTVASGIESGGAPFPLIIKDNTITQNYVGLDFGAYSNTAKCRKGKKSSNKYR